MEEIAFIWQIEIELLQLLIEITKSYVNTLLLQKHPTRVIENAVKGMLPKNPLGRAMFSKLRVYAGPEHQHQAQQPKALEI